jgi:hypothetical protein
MIQPSGFQGLAGFFAAVRVGRWGEASQRRMGGGGFADVSETPLKMTIRKHGWPAFSGI